VTENWLRGEGQYGMGAQKSQEIHIIFQGGENVMVGECDLYIKGGRERVLKKKTLGSIKGLGIG